MTEMLRDTFLNIPGYPEIMNGEIKKKEEKQRHRGKPNKEQRVSLRKTIADARAVRVAPGVFDLRKENLEMQRDMDALFRAMPPTKLQNKNKPATLIETKLKQKNMEPKFTMDTPPVEKDKTETQKYNEGYERIIWSKDKTKSAPEKETSANIDNWQDEAVQTFEKSGGKVLDTQVVQEVESSHSIKNWQDEAIKNFEKGGGKVIDTETKESKDSHTLNVEQAADFIKAQEGLKAANSDVETRAKEAGVPLGIIGKVGELYNKSSSSFKWAISGALLASVVGGGLIGAAGLLGTAGAIGIGMRVLGSAGLFVTLENVLKNSYEKAKGKEREESVKARHTAEAAALAISLGVFIPDIIRTGLQATGLSEVVLNKLSGAPASTLSPEIPQTQTQVEYIKDVKAGDSAWKLASGIVSEKFPNLSTEQQTYFTDAIKDRVVKHPESFGISGSDVNNLAIGEKIDFGGILNDEEFMSKTLADAQNLNAEEIRDIKNYNNDLTPTAEAPATEPTGFIKEEFKPWEPVIPAVDGSSPSTNLTTEGPSAGQEAGNPNALVEAGSMKGSFQYSTSGEVVGFITNELGASADGRDLLNDDWRSTVRNHSLNGVTDGLNIRVIDERASTIAGYEKVIAVLEQDGVNNKPKIDFLRDQIQDIVARTEATYGDVFKDFITKSGTILPISSLNLPTSSEIIASEIVEKVAPPTSIIDWPTDPQTIADGKKVTDLNIKSAFGKEGGWFGIGATDGQEIFKNFADNTVEDILSRKDKIPSVDMDKLITMLEEARKQTGIPWDSKITVRDYLDFSATIDIENYKKGR